MTAPTLEVNIGDELPSFSRRTGFAEWNRYAAVNDEFVDIHMDDAAGKKAGLPGAIGMGNLQLAYLHNLVRDWLGGSGRIVRMSCRWGSPNLKGQVVTAHGRATEITETAEGREVVLDVWTTEQDGNRLASGSCTVLIDKPEGEH